jgi:hypothetical protein
VQGPANPPNYLYKIAAEEPACGPSSLLTMTAAKSTSTSAADARSPPPTSSARSSLGLLVNNTKSVSALQRCIPNWDYSVSQHCSGNGFMMDGLASFFRQLAKHHADGGMQSSDKAKLEKTSSSSGFLSTRPKSSQENLAAQHHEHGE